jgi:hypothetical protein
MFKKGNEKLNREELAWEVVAEMRSGRESGSGKWTRRALSNICTTYAKYIGLSL